MASRPTPTVTETQVQERCRDLILRLRSTGRESGRSEAASMVAEVQRRVDAIFNQFLDQHVYNGQGHIRENLLAVLTRAKNPDTVLEAFLVELYHEAIKREKELVGSQISKVEREEMEDLSKKVSEENANKNKKGMMPDHNGSHKETSI